MIGCLRTRVHKQPIIALYFESENVLKFYNLEARLRSEIALDTPPPDNDPHVQWKVCEGGGGGTRLCSLFSG